jgi:hypothetical protein
MIKESVATTAFVKTQGYLTSVTHANISGTVEIAHGGTGATTRILAMNALGFFAFTYKILTGDVTNDGYNSYMDYNNNNITTSSIIL